MDIIAGSPCWRGYVEIYFGSSDFDTIADLKIIGEDEGPYGHYTSFGTTVACAGDVNNDGYDDVIVGATSAYNPNNGADWAGKAYIFLGGDPMDTTADVILQDSDYLYFFGHSLCSAGDVNNDGYDDVIVGANLGWWCDGCGFVYIYFGGEDMDSVCDVYFQGAFGDQMGESVAGIGDINSDGYDDVLIGSSKAGESWGTGKASVFFGGDPMDTIPDFTFWGDSATFYSFGRNVAPAGDVNGDGVTDILVAGSGRYTKLFYTISLSPELRLDTLNLFGEDILPSAFGRSVSTAGDINKDGFDDFVVTDTDCGLDLKGKAYVFYGGEDVDSLWDLTLSGRGNRKEHFGLGLAYAGDVNGDGFDEILVSSNFDSTHIGEVFIFTSAPTSTEEPSEESEVNNFHLRQNYPNPFNSETVIEYVLPENSQVKLSIYNILGQKVRTLVYEHQTAGFKTVHWDGTTDKGSKVSTGIYLYKLQAGEFTETKKMLLLK
jgi:hypothetical protein